MNKLYQKIIDGDFCSLEKADFNVRGPHQNTLLIYLLQQGVTDYSIFSFILDHGADPNVWNNHGETPLLIASRLAVTRKNEKIHKRPFYYPIIKLLLQSGADPNYLNKDDLALFEIVKGGDYRICRILLQWGADPNFYVAKCSPFWQAILSEKRKIVHLLHDHGGSVDLPEGYLADKNKNENLPHVNYDGNPSPQFIMLLIELGVEPSPLLLESSCIFSHNDSHLDVIEYIINNDYMIDYYVSSIYAIVETYNPKMLLLLLRARKLPKIILNNLLRSTIEYNRKLPQERLEMVRILLHEGADVNSVDEFNKTAISLVFHQKHDDRLITLLLDYGAQVDGVIIHNKPFREYIIEQIHTHRFNLRQLRKFEKYLRIINNTNRLFYQKVIQEVHNISFQLRLQPGSLISQIMECYMHMGQYHVMKTRYSDLMKMLQITDESSYRSRIREHFDHF